MHLCTCAHLQMWWTIFFFHDKELLSENKARFSCYPKTRPDLAVVRKQSQPCFEIKENSILLCIRLQLMFGCTPTWFPGILECYMWLFSVTFETYFTFASKVETNKRLPEEPRNLRVTHLETRMHSVEWKPPACREYGLHKIWRDVDILLRPWCDLHLDVWAWPY